MTVALSPLFVGYQILNHSGLPNAGGLIYVYQAGTSTPATTYTDSSGTIANTNPIQLNAAGYAPYQIWVTEGASYKFVIEDSLGSVLGTYDNIPGINDIASIFSAPSGASLIGTADGGTLANSLLAKISTVVNSIPALRAISKADYTRSFATGYYAAGDGGGGSYWYDPTDTTSPDNGGTIIVATDGARWKLAPTGPVSVKQFGAKIDGTTDDTTPFTNAQAAGVGVPFIPDGSVKLTGTVAGTFFTTGVVTFVSGGVQYLLGTYNPTYISNDRYNQLVSLLRTLRDGGKTLAYGINCLGDGYVDQTGVNTGASTNIMFDSRYAFEPTRSQSTSVGSDPCDSLTGWTTFNSGTASMSAVADANNPVVPNQAVFLFSTGATLGSVAGLQKNFGTIPDANFSIGTHIDIESTGTNAADSFEVQVISASGYTLHFRAYSGAIDIFQDGAWQNIANYGGGNLYTEWWVNAQQVSGSSYAVSVYAGTELLGSRTGNLAGGGTAGLVVYQKNSGATANQSARVAYCNIGATQKPDNITLISNPAQYLNSSPLKCRLLLLVEDTSLALAVNTNLTAQVSQNGGTSWENVTFTDMGTFALGVVDNTKKVHMLVAEHTFANVGATQPTYKITSSQNWWFALMGAAMEWF